MRSAHARRLASAGGRLLLDPLMRTLRFEVRGAEHIDRLERAGEPFIYVLWHGRLLPLTWYHRQRGIATLISRSRDGDLIADAVERWGYHVVRGSSSRGGSEGLRALLRHARRGRSLAITPDGPRGPRERLKPGVLLAAQLSGLPLLPLAGGAERAWWFEGWDRFLVPKPFARIRVAYGRPLRVPRAATPEEVEDVGRRLQAELGRLMAHVDGGADVL